MSSGAPVVAAAPPPTGDEHSKCNNKCHDIVGGGGGSLDNLVKVLYVHKRNAKTVKNNLQKFTLLNQSYRMTSATISDDCIAIPISDEYFNQLGASSSSSPPPPSSMIVVDDKRWNDMIVNIGYQICPYSTKMLGNNKINNSKPNDDINNNQRLSIMKHDVDTWNKLTLVQKAILQTIQQLTSPSPPPPESEPDPSTKEENAVIKNNQSSVILQRLRMFDRSIIPKSIEIFGDDRTLVLSSDSFTGNEFIKFMLSSSSSLSPPPIDTTNDDDGKIDQIGLLWDTLWKSLASIHGNSPRIVRRGTIDPNSNIRQSGHSLIWTQKKGSVDENSDTKDDSGNDMDNDDGWITVTEQGIKQSFDMTKVMFSRGNITEKIRLGKLVKEGDVVLDMYAGIGYYTLPALIKGKASKVISCEWNPIAVKYLKNNVQDNGIDLDRVAVYEGDCRKLAKDHNLINMFDRVSLGLLPSSEGGWRTAIRALKLDIGGWLHVHGNVVDEERDNWVMWLCTKLLLLCNEEKRPNNWSIRCKTLERVKSFAPTVSHYVADVYVGPNLQDHGFVLGNISTTTAAAAVVVANHEEYRCGTCHTGSYIPCFLEDIKPPSCALSSKGVLNQEWMMEGAS